MAHVVHHLVDDVGRVIACPVHADEEIEVARVASNVAVYVVGISRSVYVVGSPTLSPSIWSKLLPNNLHLVYIHIADALASEEPATPAEPTRSASLARP